MTSGEALELKVELDQYGADERRYKVAYIYGRLMGRIKVLYNLSREGIKINTSDLEKLAIDAEDMWKIANE